MHMKNAKLESNDNPYIRADGIIGNIINKK